MRPPVSTLETGLDALQPRFPAWKRTMNLPQPPDLELEQRLASRLLDVLILAGLILIAVAAALWTILAIAKGAKPGGMVGIRPVPLARPSARNCRL